MNYRLFTLRIKYEEIQNQRQPERSALILSVCARQIPILLEQLFSTRLEESPFFGLRPQITRGVSARVSSAVN